MASQFIIRMSDTLFGRAETYKRIELMKTSALSDDAIADSPFLNLDSADAQLFLLSQTVKNSIKGISSSYSAQEWVSLAGKIKTLGSALNKLSSYLFQEILDGGVIEICIDVINREDLIEVAVEASSLLTILSAGPFNYTERILECGFIQIAENRLKTLPLSRYGSLHLVYGLQKNIVGSISNIIIDPLYTSLFSGFNTYRIINSVFSFSIPSSVYPHLKFCAAFLRLHTDPLIEGEILRVAKYTLDFEDMKCEELSLAVIQSLIENKKLDPALFVREELHVSVKSYIKTHPVRLSMIYGMVFQNYPQNTKQFAMKVRDLMRVLDLENETLLRTVSWAIAQFVLHCKPKKRRDSLQNVVLFYLDNFEASSYINKSQYVVLFSVFLSKTPIFSIEIAERLVEAILSIVINSQDPELLHQAANAYLVLSNRMEMAFIESDNLHILLDSLYTTLIETESNIPIIQSLRSQKIQ